MRSERAFRTWGWRTGGARLPRKPPIRRLTSRRIAPRPPLGGGFGRRGCLPEPSRLGVRQCMHLGGTWKASRAAWSGAPASRESGAQRFYRDPDISGIRALESCRARLNPYSAVRPVVLTRTDARPGQSRDARRSGPEHRRSCRLEDPLQVGDFGVAFAYHAATQCEFEHLPRSGAVDRADAGDLRLARAE
jgi:hypothetical protein